MFIYDDLELIAKFLKFIKMFHFASPTVCRAVPTFSLIKTDALFYIRNQN